ncbi:unnamed protein product [Schistosoma haematobium]|nr:unnamed protein product [Schistosoma haematobium]
MSVPIKKISKRTMNTHYCTIFIVVIIYAYFDMVNGVPEPNKFVDEDGAPVRGKPATPIKVSAIKIPVNKTMEVETSQKKDKKAKSSSSTLTIGSPIVFIITPFVISKFLL